MTTHQRTAKPVTAVQWVKGTTTLDAIRALVPDAFTVNGDLLLPNSFDGGKTASLIASFDWVIVDGDGPSEAWVVMPPQTFATEYEEIVTP